MSTYFTPELSVNIFESDNFISLLKFYGINVIISFAIMLIITFIMSVVDKSYIGMGLLLISILAGQLFSIRLFEKWDGCQFVKK